MSAKMNWGRVRRENIATRRDTTSDIAPNIRLTPRKGAPTNVQRTWLINSRLQVHQRPKCKACDTRMAVKATDDKFYWGCLRHPICAFTLEIDQDKLTAFICFGQGPRKRRRG